MASIGQIEVLKGKVESLQREADKAAGQFEACKKRLKDEFGCDSLKEAEALLEKMTRETQGLEKEVEQALEKFKKEYADVLEGQ